MKEIKKEEKKKLFVLSDVHGHYDEMKSALNDAGFDQSNESHWVVVCGDYFDRGPDPAGVMKYLMGLPRKVLIKGNHESLFEQLCERGFPYNYDKSNGTLRTVWQLGLLLDINECYEIALSRVKPFFNQMVNYFETKNYIFVHSWIPLKNKDGLPAHYIRGRKFEFNPDWRNENQEEWDDAMWGNPFDLAEQGFLPDKTVVFGHWHASAGWAKSEGRSEFGEDAKFDPYYDNGFISIDACTAHSGKVNVLVLEDEFLEE